MNFNTINIYGIQPLCALISKNPNLIRKILVQQNSTNKRILQILEQIQHKATIEFVAPEVLTRTAETNKHQGIVAICDLPAYHDMDYLKSFIKSVADSDKKHLILVLDGIQDPRNLGACLRTADAAGVDLVILPKHHSAGMTQVVHKTSAGAAFWLPVVIVNNLANTLSLLKENQFWIMGAAVEAKSSLYDLDFNCNVVLTLGSEGKGLANLTQKLCDELFYIPMLGNIESLNVSVATGVALYEIIRQQQQKTKII